MNYKIRSKMLIVFAASMPLLVFSVNALPAVEADAAKALARQNNCFKCHSVDKDKDGPTFSKIAAKYKGMANAEQRLVTYITTGEKAKFPDGHEEEHKIIKAKDVAEIKNLVNWVLAQ